MWLRTTYRQPHLESEAQDADGAGNHRVLVALEVRRGVAHTVGLDLDHPQQDGDLEYVLRERLVNEPVEAADDKQLSKTIARYGRVDLLICDELGYPGLTGVGPNCCSRF